MNAMSLENNRFESGRRGISIIYVTLALVVLFGFAALGVDFGRIQLAKTQLQAAADASARYGAMAIRNEFGGRSGAFVNAALAASENRVDGRPVVIDPQTDIEIGIWNPNDRTFTPTGNANNSNAVRVTLHCRLDRGNAIPLLFGKLIGRENAPISASAIAFVSFTTAANAGAGGGRFDYYVPATSNPWLAGMPPGTIANPGNPHRNPDFAGTEWIDDGSDKKDVWSRLGVLGQGSSTNPGSALSNWALWGAYASKKSSPIRAGQIPITPGATISFDGISGGASNFNTLRFLPADGDVNQIVQNFRGNENGIANIRVPINALIGVFLSDDQPSNSPPPPMLDFSTPQSRNFTHLEPKLKQPFFIGDGRTDMGEVQRFVVPEGATRLFLGTMDSFEWSNNVGGFHVSAHVTGRIVLVK